MSHNDQNLEKEDTNSSSRNGESIITDENCLTVDGDCIVVTTLPTHEIINRGNGQI